MASVNPVAFTLDAINAVPAQPDFIITAPETAVAPGGTGTATGTGPSDSPDAARFRLALVRSGRPGPRWPPTRRWPQRSTSRR